MGSVRSRKAAKAATRPATIMLLGFASAAALSELASVPFPRLCGNWIRAFHSLVDFLHDPRCFFPHFTLPVTNYTPPSRLQPSVVPSGAGLVLAEFLVPEGVVMHWGG